MTRTATLCLALAGATTIVHAQPGGAVEPDRVWLLYDEAFREAATGHVDVARTKLAEIVAQYTTHPAAARARMLLDRLAATEREEREEDELGPSKIARGELVFWSTIGSLFVGANVCQIAGCDSPRAYAATYTLAVGGALGASLFAGRNVHQGEAQLYNSAHTWGAWNSFALNDGFAADSTEALTAIGIQISGVAVAYGLWKTWHPTQGDVALANSGLIWSTVLALELHAAADATPTLARTVLLGDLGIAAGAVLSTQLKMSRGRTFMIDVGGVLGSLFGGLIAINTDDSQAAGTALFAGTAAGLGIAFVASKDWDAPKLPVMVTPTPIHGPGSTGLGLSAIARW